MQLMVMAPGGGHPQIERVGVTGQAAVAGKKAGQGDPLWLGEQRLDRYDDLGRGDGGGHGDLRSSD
jgi:hypothetical protein